MNQKKLWKLILRKNKMFKDILTKKENQIMIGVIVLSIILIMLGFYFLNKNGEDGLGPRDIPNSEKEIVWKIFDNNKFNFSLEYPEHFEYSTDSAEFGPVFNFYFDKGKNNLPFDIFVNQSHISVYPEGIRNIGLGHLEFYTERDFVNSKGIQFKLREYKTVDGDIWAILAKPENTPKSWVDFGFVWISSKIIDIKSRCFDGSAEKEVDSCNPLEGDQFYLDGKVDSEFISIGMEMLDKLSFQD